MSLLKDMFPSALDQSIPYDDTTVSLERAQILNAAQTVRGTSEMAIILTIMSVGSILEHLGAEMVSHATYVIGLVLVLAVIGLGIRDAFRKPKQPQKFLDITIKRHDLERVAIPMMWFCFFAYIVLILVMGLLAVSDSRVGEPISKALEIIVRLPWLGLACAVMAYGAFLRWKEARAVETIDQAMS